MNAADALTSGIRLGSIYLRAVRMTGRFPEEENLEVYACYEETCGSVFLAKVFHGRPPHYRPWIEVFSVDPRLYTQPVEELTIALAYRSLPPGGRLMVEYTWDPLTLWELEHGVPPQVTRLGSLMFLHGFTWFKDWYFPEGFMEGTQKLQGEKPIDEDARRRHLREALEEIQSFLVRCRNSSHMLAPACSRARTLLYLIKVGS